MRANNFITTGIFVGFNYMVYNFILIEISSEIDCWIRPRIATKFKEFDNCYAKLINNTITKHINRRCWPRVVCKSYEYVFI